MRVSRAHQPGGLVGRDDTRFGDGKCPKRFALANFVGQADTADFAAGIKFFSKTGRIRKFWLTHSAILAQVEPAARYGFKTFVFRHGATRNHTAPALPCLNLRRSRAASSLCRTSPEPGGEFSKYAIA